MNRIPNILSTIRIILSISLLLLLAKPVPFFIVYMLCGISDFADGYIARKLKAETATGAKLDSIGDFLLFGVALIALFTLIDEENYTLLVFTVIIVAVIRFVNIIIGRIKFKQWGIMHTIGNKVTGFVLFVTLPVCVLTGSLPYAAIICVGIIAALSALEETAILLTSKVYDADRKSIYKREKPLP